jgi:hypothetical protein
MLRRLVGASVWGRIITRALELELCLFFWPGKAERQVNFSRGVGPPPAHQDNFVLLGRPKLLSSTTDQILHGTAGFAAAVRRLGGPCDCVLNRRSMSTCGCSGIVQGRSSCM